MSDRGDHGDRALGDRSDEALVAEGEQILEAAAAAGQDDHVDVLVFAEGADRGHDLGGRARALNVGLRDEDRGRWEAGPDRRHDVALRSRVVAGHDADAPRQQWQRALAGVGEEALGGKGRLQPLERGEVGADAETLDRQRAELELAALLVQLRPAEHVHALAVREVEPQRVEPSARHRDPHAGTVGRILEREEDRCPPFVPAELGHLALDPDRGEARQPLPDPAIERGDRVDGAIVVRQRLDLGHGRSVVARLLQKDLGSYRRISAAVSGWQPRPSISQAIWRSASLTASRSASESG